MLPPKRPHMPAGSGRQRNTSASACDGVLKPSVCRGRRLSLSAMASKSAWVRVRKSRVRGRYWRSSPLVFSLLPRCQGLLLPGTLGIAEVDLDTGLVGEPEVFGHLVALVPGQGPGQR